MLSSSFNMVIEHDFDDLYNRMAKERIFNKNTFVGFLKKAGKELLDDLAQNAPDSLRNYAQSSRKNASYSKVAQANRAKYGEMNKALGMYKSRSQNSLNEHSVTIGYLASKQKKAFVSNFLNYGWKASNGVFQTKHLKFMQKAEQRTAVKMKAVFDAEVVKSFEEEIAKKWASSRNRRV